MDPHSGGPPVAVVLVRASSPFLSNAVLAQREAACVALTRAWGSTVELVPRTSARDHDAIDLLGRQVAATGATAVVTWSAYGLVSSPAELAVVAELMRAGVEVFEGQSGQLVPVTAQRIEQLLPTLPSSQLTEARRHAVRTREGRQAVAREGGWLGGRCPLGWVVTETGDVELDVVAACHIRTATRQVAAGTRVGLIAAEWNAAGFTTVTGRRWTFGSTRRVLLRPRNAGLAEYRGQIVGPSAWPAIVTVADWRLARRQLVPRPGQKIA